jgi:hypothetical protein
MELEEIIAAIAAGRVRPSRHSLSEAANDDLVLGEIYWSVTEGGIILETYLDAYPLPACLILGFNTVDDPIHSVWSYDEVSAIAKLVTVYRPDPKRWINWSIRK